MKMIVLAVITIFAGLGFYYAPVSATPPSTETTVAAEFDCAKKTCKKMSSCAEACYKFKVCGHKQLDRDNDDIPCENVCSKPCP